MLTMLKVMEATVAKTCFPLESQLRMERQWEDSIKYRLSLRIPSQGQREVLAASLALNFIQRCLKARLATSESPC